MAMRSVNPATEEEMVRFEEHTPAEVDLALALAAGARQTWAATSVSARASRFAELAASLRHDRPRLYSR